MELAPSSEYAYYEDGELALDISGSNPALDFEGLNPESVTTFEDVFRVRYTGSEYAHLWLTHESDAVTFRVEGEPVQSEANNVTLAPDETVSVGLVVDTRGEPSGELPSDFTVHTKVAEPENVESSGDAETLEFDGTSLQSRSPTADSRRFVALGASAGDELTLNASALELDRADGATLTLDELRIRNGGGSLSLGVQKVDDPSSESLVVAEGAEPLGAAEVTVDAGAVDSATLRFSVAQRYFDARAVTEESLAVYRNDDGDLSKLNVTVTGERRGRVHFEAESPGFSTLVVAADRARTTVESASLNRTNVAPGEDVGVEATVVNDGSAAGDHAVTVSVDGEVVAERTVTVPAGDDATVTVPVSRSEPGEYAVSVDGVAAGAFTVDAAQDATSPPPTTQTETEPADEQTTEPEDQQEQAAGFELGDLLGLVAFLAIVAATLLLVRRRPAGES